MLCDIGGQRRGDRDRSSRLVRWFYDVWEQLPQVRAGLFGGTTGTGAPRYTTFTGGKSPIWNQYGHERMGWSLSTANPAAP